MRLKRWFQYRLATLLLAITFAAFALFAWMRFVAPNVVGFEIDNGRLLLQLSNELSRKWLRDQFPSEPVPLIFAYYYSISLYMVALAIALILGLAAGIYFGLRLLADRPTRHGRRTELPSP